MTGWSISSNVCSIIFQDWGAGGKKKSRMERGEVERRKGGKGGGRKGEGEVEMAAAGKHGEGDPVEKSGRENGQKQALHPHCQ